MRFWDSPALVPSSSSNQSLQRSSDGLLRTRPSLHGTLTPVELVAALRRLVRDGALVERAAREAEEVVRDLIARAHIVSDVERVKALTIRVLRVHALRAADALQLGAALAWSDGHTEGAILHTFDKRLAEAASREGFRVIPG